MKDSFFNEWLDLIESEKNLKEDILHEIGIDVIGKIFRNTDEVVSHCLKLSSEVAEETGFDLEFVYDLEVTFEINHKQLPQSNGILVSGCAIHSLFLHEKWM